MNIERFWCPVVDFFNYIENSKRRLDTGKLQQDQRDCSMTWAWIHARPWSPRDDQLYHFRGNVVRGMERIGFFENSQLWGKRDLAPLKLEDWRHFQGEERDKKLIRRISSSQTLSEGGFCRVEVGILINYEQVNRKLLQTTKEAW